MARYNKICVRCKCQRATYSLQTGVQLRTQPLFCTLCTLRRSNWRGQLKIFTKPEEFKKSSLVDESVFYRNPHAVSEETKELLKWPVELFNEYVLASCRECGLSNILFHFLVHRRNYRLFIVACLRELSECINEKLIPFLNHAEVFADDPSISMDEIIKDADDICNELYLGDVFIPNKVFLNIITASCLRYASSNISSMQLFVAMIEKNKDLLQKTFAEFTDRSLLVDKKFCTTDVIAIANKIYHDRDYSVMPILADALQDAGCDSERILTYCQKGLWHRGNLVLDSILGKS